MASFTQMWGQLLLFFPRLFLRHRFLKINGTGVISESISTSAIKRWQQMRPPSHKLQDRHRVFLINRFSFGCINFFPTKQISDFPHLMVLLFCLLLLSLAVVLISPNKRMPRVLTLDSDWRNPSELGKSKWIYSHLVLLSKDSERHQDKSER